MADTQTPYEYGRTPEETAGGIVGWFNMMRGPVVDAFTPERREVLTPPKTTYTEADGAYYKSKTPGVYGEPERGLEYMPVVQGAKDAAAFAGKFMSDGKFREQTASDLVGGIGQMFSDYTRAGTEIALGGEGSSFYDPEAKREVTFDPLFPLVVGKAAGLLAPVKGPGTVLGVFAGRNAATADLGKLAQAEKMAAKGHSRDEIMDQTGWFRYQDRDGKPMGEWRFEVSDEMSKAVFDPRVQTPTGRLRPKEKPVVSDLFQHPEIYKAFPGWKSRWNRAPTSVGSVKEVTLKRSAIKKELDELNKTDKGTPEYKAEYARLQAKDAVLLNQLIQTPPSEDEPVSVKSEPPFLYAEDRMERPIADIPLRKMDSKLWGGAQYIRYLDTVDTKSLPGQPPLDSAPWDEEGKYVRQFTDTEYKQALGKAVKDFKEAGISLEVSRMGEVDENATYRLRKWGSNVRPEGEINPESLPDYGYDSLKRQWDQLQAFKNIYYKKDYDPAYQFRRAMIHELQHAIQYRTPGFEGGGNRKEFFHTKIKDPRTGKPLSATEIYFRILGEAEARLADARRDLTDKERGERYPWTREGGLDRREEDLILRKDLPGMGGGDSFSPNNSPIPKAPTKSAATRDYWDKNLEYNAVREDPRSSPQMTSISYHLEAAGDNLREITGNTGFTKDPSITGYIAEKLDRIERAAKDLHQNDVFGSRNLSPADEARMSKILDDARNIPVSSEAAQLAKDIILSVIGGHPNTAIKLIREQRVLLGMPKSELHQQELGVERKASGGFVDKPLYDDARTGNMI